MDDSDEDTVITRFFGISATKRYYPVESFHELFSSSNTKPSMDELVWFVNEEEAEAHGYAPAQEIPCPYCGILNLLDETFCQECGCPLDATEEYLESIEKAEQVKATASTKKDAAPPRKSSLKATSTQQFTAPTGYSRLGIDTQTGQYVDVPQASRRQGLYITGIQGTGKSVLIENLIIQDIKQNMGVCLLDPHGDLTQAVLSRLPERRVKDVIYLDLNNYRYPFGVNLFQCPDLSDLVEVQKTIDQVVHVFEKLLGVSHETPLILEYLQNCTHTLIANPGYTMADIPLLLQDGACRKKLVAHVTDSDVQLFWRLHEQKKPADQSYDISSTLRRVRQFLQPLSRPIVGQSASSIDIRKVMDEGKILLVKLDTTLESITELIGALFIALFLNAAKSRADLPVQKRRQFNLYADEFQRFATEDYATLLEEARKFGVGITIAHQNGSQLETSLKERARSVANLAVFKVNSKDADELAGEFDLTPQEAWEEEIEPIRFEPVEEQIADEVEEDIMEITHEPVDYLAGYSHTHPSSIVRELIWKLILPIREAEQQPNIPKYIMKRIRGVHEQINLLLITVMEGKIQPHSEQLVNTVQEIVTRYNRIEGVLGIEWGYIPIPNMDTYLLQLCKELATEKGKVLVPTGQKRLVPKMRTIVTYHTIPAKKILHPQQTYADMHNEVASQLTNLPVFTARVKIATDNGTEEHTIRTLDPKQDRDSPLFGQALQDRIDSIKEQNKKGGYLRERVAVEEEIRQRQEQCSQPPEEEPPISRRPR